VTRVSRVAAPLAGLAALGAAIVVAPAFLSGFREQQAAYVGVYTIALLGLNVLTGYTGQISLGHGAFMAVGGYTTAILMSDHGVRDVWTIPLAGLVAGAAGVLFALPAARLSGVYLALATFGIAVAAPAMIKKFDGLTGGGAGKSLFGSRELTGAAGPVHVLGHELGFYTWLFYLTWSIALACYAAVWLLVRGRTGRALRAVRDSEVAAVSCGVGLARTKTIAFGASAACAGVAGSLLVIATSYVNPDTFRVELSVFLLAGAVVGGLGALPGVIAGAVVVEYLPFWAQDVSASPGAPAAVYGAVLIALVLALPAGAGGLLRRLGGLGALLRRQ
jgi:branched-chain amino acid transport system permease protein